MNEYNFTLLLNGIPYFIKAKSFEFNNEIRFEVTYNESEEFIFIKDAEADRFVSISEDSVDIPDGLEEKISKKLLAFSKTGFQ